jgi:hypothetical protein
VGRALTEEENAHAMAEHDALPPDLRSAALAALKELEQIRSRAPAPNTLVLIGGGVRVDDDNAGRELERFWRQHVIRLERWVHRTADLLRVYDGELSKYLQTCASKALASHDQKTAFFDTHAQCCTILTDAAEAPGSERKAPSIVAMTTEQPPEEWSPAPTLKDAAARLHQRLRDFIQTLPKDDDDHEGWRAAAIRLRQWHRTAQGELAAYDAGVADSFNSFAVLHTLATGSDAQFVHRFILDCDAFLSQVANEPINATKKYSPPPKAAPPPARKPRELLDAEKVAPAELFTRVAGRTWLLLIGVFVVAVATAFGIGREWRAREFRALESENEELRAALRRAASEPVPGAPAPEPAATVVK